MQYFNDIWVLYIILQKKNKCLKILQKLPIFYNLPIFKVK